MGTKIIILNSLMSKTQVPVETKYINKFVQLQNWTGGLVHPLYGSENAQFTHQPSFPFFIKLFFISEPTFLYPMPLIKKDQHDQVFYLQKNCIFIIDLGLPLKPPEIREVTLLTPKYLKSGEKLQSYKNNGFCDVFHCNSIVLNRFESFGVNKQVSFKPVIYSFFHT